MINKLSIIIPVYNESKTIFEVLQKVTEVDLIGNIEKEIIVVNDRSSDNSQAEIDKFVLDYPTRKITLLNHLINTGKGGAVISGLAISTGDYIVIQDADLELVPDEFNVLLAPVLSEEAKIVFGSRFINQTRKSNESILNHTFNKFITWLGGIIFGIKLTDTQTCYKLIPSDLFKKLDLKEKRFGFDTEVTAKLAKITTDNWIEVPITYNPRTSVEGKKIGWKDGIRALYCVIKYGI